MNSDIIIGIDFGSTFSAVSFVNDEGEAIIIPNSEHQLKTPSVVAFKDNQVIVGSNALSIVHFAPNSVVTSIKKQIGLSSYRFVTSDGKSISIEQISAYILQKLKNDAEAFLGTQISKAVISVPYYFTHSQNYVIKEACAIAGLDAVSMIPDPIAAVIGYGLSSSDYKQVVIVYDLGGTSFDVSIVQVNGTRVSVLYVSGDSSIGGVNFDYRLMSYLSEKYEEITGVSIPDDPITQHKLHEIAEQTKIYLSAQDKVEVNLQFGETTTSLYVTRQIFENQIVDIIDLTISYIEKIINNSGISFIDISQILLAGGSTNIPIVRNALIKKFGDILNTSVNPEYTVVIGAAIYAYIHKSEGSFVKEKQNQQTDQIKLKLDGEWLTSDFVLLFTAIQNIYTLLLTIDKKAPESSPLKIRQIKYGSPGYINLSGLGEPIKAIKELFESVATITLRYRKEKLELELKKREIQEKDLELKQKEFQIQKESQDNIISLEMVEIENQINFEGKVLELIEKRIDVLNKLGSNKEELNEMIEQLKQNFLSITPLIESEKLSIPEKENILFKCKGF